MPRLSDVELLARLVAFDSTSCNSNLPIAEFIADYLDRPGVKVEQQPSPDGDKTNLVVIAGPETDDSDRAGLALSGHMDVVPADEPEWTGDPFELRDDGDRFLGRGACDMKGFVALAINAIANVEPDRLRRPLALVLTYDEELGTIGARHFAHSWPRQRLLPRRMIVGEPTSLAAVRLHKGHAKLRLVVRGRSAHSGYPHLGDNAIEPLGQAITALSDLRRELEAEGGPNAEHFPSIGFVALNLARIEGGTAINIIPDHAKLDLGFRLLPGMSTDPIIERIRERTAAALGDRPFELERRDESPPMLLADDNDFYRDICDLVGQRETVSASYATDAGWLQDAGFDCLLLGPGSIEVAHRPDEWIPKDELARAGRLLGHLVERYCAA